MQLFEVLTYIHNYHGILFLGIQIAPSLVGLAPASTDQNNKDARKIKIREVRMVSRGYNTEE